ncbi:hypothetical protein F5Y05DRAFT_416695 [Hypoxylon sp. FL0543]|nr:hypothetical protein F5Y05DRAFT_416695 [Hypoxylon sp. FL0543]
MTRRLPWKKAETSAVSTPKSTALTPVRQVNIKRDDSDTDDRKVAASSTSTKRVKRSPPGSTTPGRPPRAGSTSPPPEPLSESYMIEGIENDDLYRMVEDEFLSIAQQFTAHLHAAEYHRLKAASKSQNADTIRDISRPVVGRMTDLVKKKQDRKTRFEKQKEATRKAFANKGQTDDETERKDDSWQSTSLHGLMERPRQEATRLDNLTRVTATTRTAAGFSTAKTPSFARPLPTLSSRLPGSKPTTKPILKGASETEDDDGDDDLPVSRLNTRSLPIQKAPPLSLAQTPKSRQAQTVTRGTLPSGHCLESIRPITQTTEPKPTTEAADSLEDSHSDFLARLKRRQEERKRNREQRKLAANKTQPKPKTTEDIIPGFL